MHKMLSHVGCLDTPDMSVSCGRIKQKTCLACLDNYINFFFVFNEIYVSNDIGFVQIVILSYDTKNMLTGVYRTNTSGKEVMVQSIGNLQLVPSLMALATRWQT